MADGSTYESTELNAAKGVASEDQFVQGAAVPIAVRDSGGDGAPIVLLHGIGRTLLDWEAVLPLLSAEYRVISMDLRNHGHSGAGVWTWPAVLSDVSCVLTRFDARDAVLVGHSLGGIIAACYAQAHPATRGVINLDGFGKGRPEQYVGIAPIVVRERLRRVTVLEAAHLGAVLTPQEAEAQIAQAQQPQPTDRGAEAQARVSALRRRFEAVAEGVAQRPSRAEFVEIREQLALIDIFEVVASLRCPTLMVRATQPTAQQADIPWLMELHAAHAKGMQSRLDQLAATAANIRVQYLDASHALVAEQPEAVAALISHFVNSMAYQASDLH